MRASSSSLSCRRRVEWSLTGSVASQGSRILGCKVTSHGLWARLHRCLNRSSHRFRTSWAFWSIDSKSHASLSKTKRSIQPWLSASKDSLAWAQQATTAQMRKLEGRVCRPRVEATSKTWLQARKEDCWWGSIRLYRRKLHRECHWASQSRA